ncbi:Nif11-like leader peptide family RiPP precursor [Candidatus Saccharibacteria bacterium]|jgi:predicted ribosomally synthesized peptide with nif11-like leader|nr:Nif11-like leader peptide family RiPP precursor [Candidatus Saccharibacteria bacterium]
MPINKNELTREQITKAMACETAEDLMALVKAKGHEITKEEAEACMAELADIELDEATLQQVAGGSPKISDILKSTTAILMFL